MKDIFLKLMFNILKNYMHFIMIFALSRERIKVERVEELVPNLLDKTQYVIHIRKLKNRHQIMN